MTLLPVAQRELLAAARRPATFRVRIGSALVAAAFAVIVLVFIGISGAGQSGGQFLFSNLWWGIQGFAILAGTFLTADAISEERRDGTLGLLFLTDLGGFELVVGKFVGAGLNAAYGMAAAFPILATAWFLGGITNGEFWRALLVSFNTLFVSLSLGLCVSAVSREQSRAVGATLFLQLVLQLAFPIGATLARSLQSAGRLPPALPLDLLDWVSPAGAALRAREFAYLRAPGGFWSALATSHAVGWLLLAAAGFLMARTWREGGTSNGLSGALAWATARFGGGTHRRRTAAQVDRNPLAAMFRRDSGNGRRAWLLAGATAVAAIAAVVAHRFVGTIGKGAATAVFVSVSVLASSVFRILVAWESTAFFGEAKRSGALDLALTTTLTDAEIRSSQSSHVWASFAWPLAVFCVADAVGYLAVVQAPFGILSSLGMALQTTAMVPFGAWLSLTERRPLVATAKTFAYCGLLPALLTQCCIGLAIPPILLAWATGKLGIPVRQIAVGVRNAWQIAPGSRP